MHTQTMLIGSLPSREENFTVMQLFFLFCHINLQYKHTFDKIEQEKNWTESNHVCGFVGEIGAYHISYNCFQIRVLTVFGEFFSKNFEDFISYLTTFDSISLKLLSDTVYHAHFSDDPVNKDINCLIQGHKTSPWLNQKEKTLFTQNLSSLPLVFLPSFRCISRLKFSTARTWSTVRRAVYRTIKNCQQF